MSFHTELNNFKSLKEKISLMLICLFSISVCAQQKIEIKGKVVDNTGGGIPFASITILNKSIGAPSTEEGAFYILVSENELLDEISISSMGFDTFKIKVRDFLNLKVKAIVLQDSAVLLNDIEILSAKQYVENAFKNLKKNTISDKHQLNILHRVATTEGDKAKFLTESYVKLLDKGPNYSIRRMEVAELRKSADYRIFKRFEVTNPLNWAFSQNPLRPSKRANLKDYQWKKSGNSSYEGEDVIIISGMQGTKVCMKFYIGIDSYKVYKVKKPNSIFIYKKNSDGRLYLNYSNWTRRLPIRHIHKGLRHTDARNTLHKTEVFVFDIITDKKKMKVRSFGYDKDVGKLKIPYHPEFWKGISIPPETPIYKKLKNDLESIYGVSLKKQFEIVNNTK